MHKFLKYNVKPQLVKTLKITLRAPTCFGFFFQPSSGSYFFPLKLLICCTVMLYCDGVMAACRVVYEMFSGVNVTVAGPPCVFQ